MPEAVRKWIEIPFNLAYLIVIWGLVIAMWRNRSRVATADRRVADLFLWAFALLALGDTGHVGFRVLAYASGGLETEISILGSQLGLVGLGALATAITVTIFYVLMLEIWRARFDKPYGWFGYLLLGAAILRLSLMLAAANQWNSVVPAQPWSTVRNLPLMLQGLGVAYLILRDARAAQDRTFIWIGLMILISFACYIPVILLVQQAPITGMLMIPKTLAYVAIAILAYEALYGTKRMTVPTGSLPAP
jgi:hypothetical protein